MRKAISLGLILLWALFGAAQYGPGEGGYGGVSLRFSGHLVSAGSCVQEAQNLIRCRVPAGSRGTIRLTAAVTPSTYPVNISALSLPPWASFTPVSGHGTVQATCTFIPSSAADGGLFELRFRASTVYGLSSDLVVVLEVVSSGGEVGTRIATVPTYTTDPRGKFSVPAGELPSTYVTGTLNRCGDGPLGGAPISVRLIPVEGRTSIRSLSDIGGVEISSPGYGTITVPKAKLRFLSSVDIYGHVQRTIDVGTICFPSGPQTIPVMPFPIEEVPLAGREIVSTTDSQGRFEAPMPGKPDEKVWGKLVDCSTGRPLRNQRFTLSPIYTDGKLTGFRISSDTFAPETVEKFVRADFSFFGVKGYSLGEIRVSTKTKEDLEDELEPIRGGDLPRALRDAGYGNISDPEKAVLLLGKYLKGKCFRVEVSRGELVVGDGTRERINWTLLVVHIGNKTYFVEATNVMEGTPRIVGLVEKEKGAKVFVGWEVPYEEGAKAGSYREMERLSLDELERELKE